MANVKVTVMIEVDGEPLKGFPIVRRFEPVQRQSAEVNQASNVAFVSLFDSLTNHTLLFFQPLGANMAIRPNGTVGSEITVNKGGFVLILDTANFSGTTIQNNSGSSAKYQGLVTGP